MWSRVARRQLRSRHHAGAASCPRRPRRKTTGPRRPRPGLPFWKRQYNLQSLKSRCGFAPGISTKGLLERGATADTAGLKVMKTTNQISERKLAANRESARKSKRGRATLITSELKKRICAMLERGHTVKTTVAACGVSPRCYHDHCEQDAAFFAATQRARACGRARIAESILDSDDWRAKAWYLERTDPEQYARTEERQIIIQWPVVRHDAADYGTTAATLRIMLAGTHDETKRQALRLVLSETEAENGKLSRLLEHWREHGLL